MSGSGASMLGYGNTYPNSNVSGDYVNKSGANYAGNFGSNQIPSSAHSLPSPPSNVVAASGTWTGTGGKRKNVNKVYRMKAGRSRKVHHTRRRRSFRKRHTGKRRRTGKKRTMRRRKQRGGKIVGGKRRRHTRRGGNHHKNHKTMRGGTYMQYESNVPYTPGYSTAGVNISPAMVGTAQPPPYTTYNHCQDNYNHYKATQA